MERFLESPSGFRSGEIFDLSIRSSGLLDVYPSDYPASTHLPSQVDQQDAWMKKQQAIRKYSEKWGIRSWININQTLPVPIRQWLGYDDFQEQFGLDQVVLDAIQYELETMQTESKQKSRSQKEDLKTEPLSFPKSLFNNQ